MARTKSNMRNHSGTQAVNMADMAVDVSLRSGPPKKRRAGPPEQRLNSHKKRTVWFRARITWPLREAPISILKTERKRVIRELPAARLPGAWQQVGPTNIGGRCTSLVCSPFNADQLWIGSAGGGVWTSNDAGITWTASWPDNLDLQIGALAIDPANPSVLYCGTGEANLSADSYPGDGIYRSSNGGKSWKRWAQAEKHVPRRIGVIAVDPFDSGHVLVGGVGYGRLSRDNDFGGLYVTSDGGATWRRDTTFSEYNYWCHSIGFDPVKRGIIYATVTVQGVRNGIYRSKDGGKSWVQLKNGLPSPDRIGRTSLAIAPSDPSIIYAMMAEAGSLGADQVLGVFRSDDSGASWTDVAGNHFSQEGQMSYGNAIAVNPLNPAHVICGGVDLHMTLDSGATWEVVSHWDAKRGTAAYAHADHHALVFAHSAPTRIYSANDGGMDISEDGGNAWSNRSNGLAVTMFYDLDVAQTSSGFYGGGAQDNGTVVTTDGQANTFFELLGGDGGWIVIDPNDESHVYASYQYGGMYCFRNGATREVSPPFKPQDMGGVWMVFITFDPNDSNTVYTGNQKLYRTVDDGISWHELTPVLDGSPISAIEVAAADSNVIYVGTENGGIFRSLDRGTTWSANLASNVLPGVVITRIETSVKDARQVFLTVANFGNSHVFYSRDAGLTWVDIDNGRLPNVPHHALLIRPDAPNELYVCNDVGVFMTKNNGAQWTNLTANLPTAMVVDLVYQLPTKTLLAATYGRSIWGIKLN